MAAFDFPTSPNVNDTYTANGQTYIWDGTAWNNNNAVDNVNITANNATNETVYPVFVDGATGSQGLESDTALSYNPSTDTLTAGTFSGTATAVAANSVTLATDTTGNYVATIAGTSNEVDVTGSGSENAAVTVGLPNDVTIGNDLTVTASAIVNEEILFTERADHNFTPAATRGIVWLKNETPNKLYFTDDAGTDHDLAGGGGRLTGGGTDEIMYEHDATATTNYTVSNNNVSCGPITINTGVTITVGAGTAWAIV